MLYIIYALLSSIAYSSDVIFGKMALEEMPMSIFVFILSFLYFILGIILYIWKRNEINDYIKKPDNYKNIFYAVIAIIIGTILADIFMWYAIKLSSRRKLPIAIALIHTAPILSLFFVYLFYGEILDYRSIMGIIISVIGCGIAIYYSNN